MVPGLAVEGPESRELSELVRSRPDERKLTGFQTKKILRDAVADVVPASVRTRSKMGFPVPFGQWLREGWNDVVRDVLLDRRARERDLAGNTLCELAIDQDAVLVDLGAHEIADIEIRFD